MKQLMLVFSILVFLLACQEPERSDYDIFLDYKIEMSQTQFDSVSRNLAEQGILEYSKYEDSFGFKSGYTYDFIFQNGDEFKVLLEPRFQDDELVDLDLTFVCPDLYKKAVLNAWCRCSLDEVNELVSIYGRRYGVSDTSRFGSHTWSWEDGKKDIIIRINLSKPDHNCPDNKKVHNGKVSYQLISSEKHRKEIQKQNEKRTKLNDI